jgi:RimJ/RimL family protein N-acetyltransferase
VELSLDELTVRALSFDDAALLVDATRSERARAMWGAYPVGPSSAELAYWVRPEARGQGLAVHGVRAVTALAHDGLGIARTWLEINPTNAASLRVAERAGYRYEERLARHCREWVHADPERDSWHDCLIWAHP